MDRAITHIDLDSFFVSVERLKDSKLVGKPLIIGGGTRGVVASCSYETRQFGVHSAMPMKLARRLCPQAMVISGDMESYSKYSGLVTDIIRANAPLFEKASIDEFYLDLTGMDKFFGCFKWTSELRQTISKESGLPLSFCLSVNKLISKIGTGQVKPEGKYQVPTGTEREYIAPLPVRKMPGIGEVTAYQLSNMGVKTIRKLREIPPAYLQKEFGKSGISLWHKANAEDDTPVTPYSEQKSLSTETTFNADTTDLAELNATLIKQTESLGFDLRQLNKLTACVTVKLRYSDFNTVTKQQTIPYSASDNILLPVVTELFKKLYDRRLLIRMVGVKFSSLVPGNQQVNLFDDTPALVNLYETIDKMKKKYGADKITRAICL